MGNDLLIYLDERFYFSSFSRFYRSMKNMNQMRFVAHIIAMCMCYCPHLHDVPMPIPILLRIKIETKGVVRASSELVHTSCERNQAPARLNAISYTWLRASDYISAQQCVLFQLMFSFWAGKINPILRKHQSCILSVVWAAFCAMPVLCRVVDHVSILII